MKQENEEKAKGETALDLGNPKDLFRFIFDSKSPEDTRGELAKHANKIIQDSPVSDRYSILFLYDDVGQIDRYTSNQIYSALSEMEGGKSDNLLLILYSQGGQVEPAYLISKCCKEFCGSKFAAVIPRQAKSAATLLAIGADEIHMGPMSELGPIDPLIARYPALGLGYAVQYLASLCKRYPESSEMFAKYLSLSLDLRYLGYLERVSESAVQYAERLLKNKNLTSGQNPSSIARKLVYSYKDHSFVIDREEAMSFLGDDFVKYKTDEYTLADTLHKFFQRVTLCFRIFKDFDFSIVGNLPSGISYIERKRE